MRSLIVLEKNNIYKLKVNWKLIEVKLPTRNPFVNHSILLSKQDKIFLDNEFIYIFTTINQKRTFYKYSRRNNYLATEYRLNEISLKLRELKNSDDSEELTIEELQSLLK